MTDVEQIKSRLDVADVVGEYVQLKPAGVNFKGLCPFHDEKTPSFMVHQGKQIWHCFGCQKGGDIFSFIQEIEKIDFPEALRILASKAGITLRRQNPQVQSLKTNLRSVLAISSLYYQAVLWSNTGTPALDYLRGKRLLSEETIKRFRLGFAPPGWDNLTRYLAQKKIPHQLVAQSGLVVPKERGGYYDRFRERIMFPIHDSHDEIIGFSARLLPENEKNEKAGGKYINTPETPLFNKSAAIYGLSEAKDEIKDKGFAIFVEGQMDVIASHQANVKNVVASSGTALTSEQLKQIKRLTKRLVFALDQDTAGQAALKRAAVLAWSVELETGAIRLPVGIKDPGELAVKDPAAWLQAVRQQINVMDYLLDLTFAAYPPDSVTNKRRAAGELLALIKSLSDPIEQSHYISLLADRLKIEESYLKEAFIKIKKQPVPGPRAQPEKKEDDKNAEPLERTYDYLLTLAVKHPELLENLAQDPHLASLTGFTKRALYTELCDWYNNSDKKRADSGKILGEFSPSPGQALTYSILQLKAEQQFSSIDLAQAKNELQKLLRQRDKFLINQEINSLALQLKNTEAAPRDSGKLASLSQRLHQLTQQLKLLG